jgi:hypothetical protein
LELISQRWNSLSFILNMKNRPIVAILPDSSWRTVEDWLNWAQQFPTGPLLLSP